MAQAQGGAPDAQPQVPLANTAADSEARGLPPLTQKNWLGQELPLPKKAPPLSQQMSDVGDMFGGAATGLVSGVLGIPGNIESLGRLLLSPAGVSQKTAIPTSSEIGDSIAGPATPASAGGRAVGELMSPIAAIKGTPAVAKGATNAGGAALQQGLGLTTGAGGAAIEAAYQSGRLGGPQAAAFLNHMRNGPHVSADAVRMARDAVEELRRQRTADYRAGIGTTIQGDPTVLNFAPIDQAIQNATRVATYQGRSLSAGADRVRDAINEVVDEWRQLDPATFHTPEGLDALKKRIGNLAYEENLRNVAGPHTPGSVVVNEVYDAIRGQITRQAPGYARVMRDYMQATEELREVERSLSLGRNATTDTALRKLQSIFRNNANTNYGQRVQAGQRLNDVGTGELLPALAGQALNSATPRGIQGGVAGLGSLGGYSVGGIPGAIGYAAASSPRVVGEAAFGLGRASGAVGNALKNAGIVRGGGSVPSVGTLDPRLLAMMTPEILSQLLLQTSAPGQ